MFGAAHRAAAHAAGAAEEPVISETDLYGS
jgi:hypothetical protein